MDRPGAVAVGEESLSWAELDGRARQLAARIAGLEVVALRATASMDTIVAVCAALRAGVPLVPVPHDAGDVERLHQLRDSGAQAVLPGGPVDAIDPDGWAGLPVIGPDSGSGAAPREGAAPIAPGTALVMYTSGTTGMPKGVMIPRTAIAAGLDGLIDAWGWTPDDLLVHGLPLFHVHGLVLGVLGALRSGSSLHHTVRPTPESYARVPGTMWFGVPTVWTRMVNDPASAAELRRARLLVSGSAALPVPVFERLRELTGHEPVERYGMTETMITISARHDGERRAGWVGLPIAGIRSRIVDDDGAPTPHDGETIGELEIQGPTLFAGYLGRAETTAEQYRDGWFRTGDMACIDPTGFHRIVGRRSADLIKSGGYRIGAGEIEGVLLAHPGVAEAAVIGVPDDDLGQRIEAFVVAEGATPEELIEFVAQRLSIHKRPRRVHLVEALPRNAMASAEGEAARLTNDQRAHDQRAGDQSRGASHSSARSMMASRVMVPLAVVGCMPASASSRRVVLRGSERHGATWASR